MNLELQSTLFSQSLYVPQTQEETKEAHKPQKSLFPLAKNLLERLPEVDKYNPMINREMVLKYTFNKLLMDIEKNFKDTDFNKSKAPFLPHSFEVWRREAWEKLAKSLKNLSFEAQQQWKRKFVSKVDGDFLIRTFRELKEPYFNLIFFDNYHMPKEVKESGLKKDENLYTEIMDFSVHVANWCTQIELAADIIVRAELYGLYNIPEKKKDVVHDLTSQLKAEKKFTIQGFTNRLLNQVLIYMIKQMSVLLYGKGLGYMTLTWSGALAVLYWIVGGSAFPWAFIVSRLHIPWLLGGLVASSGLQKLGQMMDCKLLLRDMKELKGIFNHIATNICEFNDVCKRMIEDCFEAKTEVVLEERKKILSKKMDELLYLNKTEIDSLQDNSTGNCLTLEMLTLKEHEDWVIVQEKTLKEESLENGFVKYEFQDDA